MNLKEAKNLIKTVFKTQIETGVRFAIELSSGPGLGKSEGCEQVVDELSKEFGEPVAFIPYFLSTLEAPDVGGFKIPTKDTDGTPITVSSRAPWMPRANAPKYGLILLDEFRQASHDVQKPAAELLLNGRVGESQLPITYFVLAASNREKDRSGVQRELAFIANRRMLITVDPNLDAWVEWAERKNIHHAAISFAKSHPGKVFQTEIPDKPGPFCTPRTLVKTSYLIGKLDMASFTEAAMGYMGEGTAAEFVAHLRVVDELPDYEEIVAAPNKVTVPTRPDACYAVMQMIAHRVDGPTASAAFTYLKRLGREFQIAGLKATVRRSSVLMQTPEFGAWIRENKDIVLAANLVKK
jgi:hypothetical protein